MSDRYFFSIVVCTYNRSKYLNDAILSVLQADLKNEYELLIVDNKSTDETRLISEIYSKTYSQIHYFYEKEQGLSHARNRGWRESKGEYIGFLDDDAVASEEWLKVAMKVGKLVEPDAFGGRFYARFTTPKPKWYKEKYGSFLFDSSARFIKNHEFLCGGNMFIRRKTLELMGGFDNKLGMSGKKIAYGEETDFFIRLRDRFPDTKIYFDPDLYVYHLVRPEKMTLRYCFTYGIPSGIYSQRVLKHLQKSNIKTNNFEIKVNFTILELKNILINLFKYFYIVSWGVLSRDRRKYPYFENYLYEKLLSNSIRLGSNIERLRELFYRNRLN